MNRQSELLPISPSVSYALTDLTTRGDFEAFESVAGTFTSHANIALYGEEVEEVANLSAIDGSKYE